VCVVQQNYMRELEKQWKGRMTQEPDGNEHAHVKDGSNGPEQQPERVNYKFETHQVRHRYVPCFVPSFA
jgi:hypothetical protein